MLFIVRAGEKLTAFLELEAAISVRRELAWRLARFFPNSASLNGSESGGEHFPARFFALSGPATRNLTQRGKELEIIHMERFLNALIVGVVGVVIQASSANGQNVIATAEPLPLLVGQTQVRFTNYSFVYSRTFSCTIPRSLNYVQRVIIENPGIPNGTKSLEVLTESVGPAGDRLFIVHDIFSCDGYQFLDLETTD
jgi:hypothetical protein